MTQRGSEPAFPHTEEQDASGRAGMTKRELFAAFALMGHCANPTWDGVTKTALSELGDACRAKADAVLVSLEAKR